MPDPWNMLVCHATQSERQRTVKIAQLNNQRFHAACCTLSGCVPMLIPCFVPEHPSCRTTDVHVHRLVKAYSYTSIPPPQHPLRDFIHVGTSQHNTFQTPSRTLLLPSATAKNKIQHSLPPAKSKNQNDCRSIGILISPFVMQANHDPYPAEDFLRQGFEPQI